MAVVVASEHERAWPDAEGFADCTQETRTHLLRDRLRSDKPAEDRREHPNSSDRGQQSGLEKRSASQPRSSDLRIRQRVTAVPSRIRTDHHLRRSGTTTLASGACATPSDCDVWRVCPGTAGEPSNRRLAGVGTRSGAEGRTRKVPLAGSPLPASLLRALHSGASAMSDLRAVSLWFVHFSFARRRRLRRANAVLRLDSGLALTGPNPTPLPCGFRVERFASVAALHPVARALAGRCTIALQRR